MKEMQNVWQRETNSYALTRGSVLEKHMLCMLRHVISVSAMDSVVIVVTAKTYSLSLNPIMYDNSLTCVNQIHRGIDTCQDMLDSGRKGPHFAQQLREAVEKVNNQLERLRTKQVSFPSLLCTHSSTTMRFTPYAHTHSSPTMRRTPYTYTYSSRTVRSLSKTIVSIYVLMRCTFRVVHHSARNLTCCSEKNVCLTARSSNSTHDCRHGI